MQKSITTLLSATLLAFSLFTTVSAQAVLTDTLDSSGLSSCVQLTKGMTFGSRDSATEGQVSDLQFFLNDKGYLQADPTGYFGSATVAAVKAFQGANGITQNGVVGPITRGKIADISCGRDEPLTGSTDDSGNTGGLSVALSYRGTTMQGQPVTIPSNSILTGVNPLAPRTWAWTTTGAVGVSARYVISGATCAVSRGVNLVEESWQPWNGASATGNRFNGSNTRNLDQTYYGCTVEAFFTARSADNRLAVSKVTVVFASRTTTPSVYTCNGVEQATPCDSTTAPNCPLTSGVNFTAPPAGCTTNWVYDPSAGCNKPVTSCTNSDGVSQKTITILANKLNVSLNTISLVSIKETMWGDGCLGITPPNGGLCTQAFVPGYEVVLSYKSTPTANPVSYVYRTNKTGTQIREQEQGPVCGNKFYECLANPPYSACPAVAGQDITYPNMTALRAAGALFYKQGSCSAETATPTITSLSPTQARVGQVVSIDGVRFPTTGVDVIMKNISGNYSGNTILPQGSVSVVSTSRITFTVPSVIIYGCENSAMNFDGTMNACDPVASSVTPGTYEVSVKNRATGQVTNAKQLIISTASSTAVSCGTGNGTTRTSLPTDMAPIYYCANGQVSSQSFTFDAPDATKSMNWTCSNGSIASVSCSAKLSYATTPNYACGTATGVETAQTPTTGRCASGYTPSSVTLTSGQSEYLWSCQNNMVADLGPVLCKAKKITAACPAGQTRNAAGVCVAVSAASCGAQNFIWADDINTSTTNNLGLSALLNCSAPVSSSAVGTILEVNATNEGQSGGSPLTGFWQNGYGNATVECALINGAPTWKVSSSGTKTCTATPTITIGTTTPIVDTKLTRTNAPGLVCAVSPTQTGSAISQNVYSRNVSGVLTLVQTCRGNQGKIEGISRSGIQCQSLGATDTDAKCAPEGSVYINGQSVQWKGNTSGYCFADTACENGYSCTQSAGESSRTCKPMVQFSTDSNTTYLTNLPTGSDTARYRRTWAGTAWGAWTFVECRSGHHTEGNATTCVPNVKDCAMANTQGRMTYNTTTNQWGACQYVTDSSGNVKCTAGYFYDGANGCVSTSRSCTLTNPFPTRYPRGSDVAEGTQTLSGSSWGTCEVSCKGNNVKRSVSASQAGVSSFNLGYSTISSSLDYCAPVTLDIDVTNKKPLANSTKSQLTISLSNAKNLDACSLSVMTSEGVTRQINTSNRTTGNFTIQYDDLKLETVGGTVTATCQSSYPMGTFTFTKTYSAESQASYTCQGPQPANSVVHTGDSVSVSPYESYYSYSLSNTARKCEYTCASGYSWTGSSCVSISGEETGVTPTVSLTSYPTGNVRQGTTIEFTLSSTGARSCSVVGQGGTPVYLDKSTNTTSKTLYSTPGVGELSLTATCWSGYNGTGNSAQSTASLNIVCPTGTSWDGATCIYTPPTCGFGTHLENGSCVSCPSGTAWDGSSCSGGTSAYSCAGDVPINATAYDGESTGLTSSLVYTQSSYNTSRKCEFRCNTSYTWNGSSCVGSTVTPVVTLSATINGNEIYSDVIYPKNITYTVTSYNAKSCVVKDEKETYIHANENTTSMSITGITIPSTVNLVAECFSDINGGGPSGRATKSVTVKCPTGTTWDLSLLSCK